MVVKSLRGQVVVEIMGFGARVGIVRGRIIRSSIVKRRIGIL